MKKKDSDYAINCDSKYGPTFGYNDIYIDDNCNKKNSCWIMNDGIHGYECHPEYKFSLFVNTAGPNKKKIFFQYWIMKCILIITTPILQLCFV